MRALILTLLISPSILFAQRTCSPDAIPIGSPRDSVISTLKAQGCTVRIDEPEPGSDIEDDIVVPQTKGGEYDYFEVIFDKGTLRAIWSYTPYFTSAQRAFDALFRELAINSALDKGRGGDLLGQRTFQGQVSLQRPPATGDPSIHFDLPNGAVLLETKSKEAGVRIAKVRNR